MINDDKLIIDDTNRIVRHEAAKELAAQEVQAEIANSARHLSQEEAAQAASLGQQMRHQAVAEVAETGAEIDRTKFVARISQIVDFVFWVIYGLIGLEILLELIGARQNNAFRSLISTLTNPLLYPFQSLVPDPATGRFQFRISYVVALVVYILLHLTITSLLRLLVTRRTTI